MNAPLLPALVASAPALARVGDGPAPIDSLPAGELLLVLVALATVAWRWWHRGELPRVTDGAAGVVLALLPGEERRARSVARILSTPGASPTVETAPDGAALARWSAELSEPLLVELGQVLHADLLRRRVQDHLGPLEGLLRPGAREALAAGAGVQAVHEVIPGPAWLASRAADEGWCVAEVACLALVDERWQDERRLRLRHDRLRLQRPTGAAEVPLPQVLARVRRALQEDEGVLLPADTGGWVVAQLVDAELWPPTLAALRTLLARRPPSDGADASDLEDRARGLVARHPDLEADPLPRRVQAWAEAVAQVQATGEVAEGLDDRFAGPAAALLPWWRRALPALRGAAPSPAPAPAPAEIAPPRIVDVAVDPAFELVTLAVTRPAPAAGPAASDAPEPPAEERWLLGLSVHAPATGWQVLDIRPAAPPPSPPATR